MGRKIPGKKHRGVKDPMKQHAQRAAGLKKKINAPPTNPDDQPIPRSLQNLMLIKDKLKNAVLKPTKRKTKKKTKVQQGENEQGCSNEVKKMKKNPGESSRSFMMRVNQAVHSISNSKGQMEKFKMGLDSDDDDIDNSRKRRGSKFNEFDGPKKKKRKMDSDGQPKISRAKKWIMRRQMKQQRKLEESESNYAPKVDHFVFGEVVHEPPSFTAKPRKAKQQDGAPRPGRKDLLLNKLLVAQPIENKTIEQEPKKDNVNKAGKRKDLPFAVRQQLEQSQQEAIQAYRALKKAK